MSQPPLDYYHQAFEPISRSQSESPVSLALQEGRIPVVYTMAGMENMNTSSDFLPSTSTITTAVSQHETLMPNTHNLNDEADQKPVISALTSVPLLSSDGGLPLDGNQLIGLIDSQAAISADLPVNHSSNLQQLQSVPLSSIGHSLAKPMALRGDQSQMQMLHSQQTYAQPAIGGIGIASGQSQHLMQTSGIAVNLQGHPSEIESQTSIEENHAVLAEGDDKGMQISPGQQASLQSNMPASVIKVLSCASQPRPRSEKKPIPEDLKDNKYFERRKRNNMAAKKSRDSRKQREDEIAIRASFLEKENAILRAQVATLRDEANSLRQLLLSKRTGRT